MIALKLRRVGASIDLVFPEEMLKRLNASEGQEVFAIETPSGYRITTPDLLVKQQVETGEVFMERYLDVFSALAK
jgi:antitoxin component of MazEF toxin-antitoxin module